MTIKQSDLFTFIHKNIFQTISFFLFQKNIFQKVSHLIKQSKRDLEKYYFESKFLMDIGQPVQII